MIYSARQAYNNSFSQAAYLQMLAHINNSFGHPVRFRVSESPVFIPKGLREKMLEVGEAIVDVLVQPDFKALTEQAIPPGCRVPNEDAHPLFLALDYGIVAGANGDPEPRLIEMQGFPSLYFWQDFVSEQYRQHFDVPSEFSSHFNLSSEEYRQLLTKSLLGDVQPAETVLLELDPEKQNTSIDFYITRHYTGIEPIHLGDVKRSGEELYYRTPSGKHQTIRRIYNRIIFDELLTRNDSFDFNLTEPCAVSWAGHPNWFFRVSKYTMPMLRHRYVPRCHYLSELHSIPADLENYVLKPLFSFSGTGVIFHVRQEDIETIDPANRHNFLLQEKVSYAPIIQAPDGTVKTEIRILYLWPTGFKRPIPVTNLARMSRGEMIGVKYNKDKTWVGGSVGFFEP